MRHLHPSQQKILNYLLKNPEGATAEELASLIGVTKTAARQHLVPLRHLGFLECRDLNCGVGRPRRHYLISQVAKDQFPKQYSWIANTILNELSESLDPAEMTEFMRRLADRVTQDLGGKLKELEGNARIEGLVRLMIDLGYVASVKSQSTKNGSVIEAFNCVYHDVAKSHPELCAFDLRLLENASGQSAKLESCIARGGVSCRFRLGTADSTAVEK